MSNKNIFPGEFKTVKVGEGKGASYDLLYIDEKGLEKKIGNEQKLVGAKQLARMKVLEEGDNYTHFKIIHHKPGREKDAKETLATKAL